MIVPLVVCLPGQEQLAARLSEALDGEIGTLEARHFPDGETYLRLASSCEGRDVALAATLARPDPLALPLLFAARGLRDQGARRVVLAAPYLAYLRQDKQFRPGEVITSAWFAHFLSDLFDGIATIDPHLHRYQTLGEIYRVPTRMAHAAPAMADWIARNVHQPLIVGPDSESEQWVSEVARMAAAPHVVLSKVRRGDRKVVVNLPALEQWRGRTPVLVDDIISTARTMIETVAHFNEAQYPAPVCVAVHAIFADDAYPALVRSGPAAIVTGDTIPHPTNRIELVPALAGAVAALFDEQPTHTTNDRS